MNNKELRKRIKEYFAKTPPEQIDNDLLKAGLEFDRTFTITSTEIVNVRDVLREVNKEFGSFGTITYLFTHTGSRLKVEIKSSHSDKLFDVTDYSKST